MAIAKPAITGRARTEPSITIIIGFLLSLKFSQDGQLRPSWETQSSRTHTTASQPPIIVRVSIVGKRSCLPAYAYPSACRSCGISFPQHTGFAWDPPSWKPYTFASLATSQIVVEPSRVDRRGKVIVIGSFRQISGKPRILCGQLLDQLEVILTLLVLHGEPPKIV